jgi:cation transport regulator ChaC
MNETTTYTEQQLDDWANIFGASAGMWSWWHEMTHVTGDWDTPGHLVLAIDDPDEDGVVHTIVTDPQEVFDALHKAEVLYPHLYHRNRDGFLDLDASSADVVLQVLIFGEAIYG